MYLLVIVGRSFLEIVDHTHMIEQLYCVVHKDNDKQARYVEHYSETQYGSKECHDRPK